MKKIIFLLLLAFAFASCEKEKATCTCETRSWIDGQSQGVQQTFTIESDEPCDELENSSTTYYGGMQIRTETICY